MQRGNNVRPGVLNHPYNITIQQRIDPYPIQKSNQNLE